MDGWDVAGPPRGQRAEPEQLHPARSRRVPGGRRVATDDSLYFGFGFEGITAPAARAAVMGRAMDYLLRYAVDIREIGGGSPEPSPDVRLGWRIVRRCRPWI